jgi:hypothetical protein
MLVDRSERTHELLVFLSYANDDPQALAKEMIAALHLPYISVGVDAMTGSVEMRLHFLEETKNEVTHWLNTRCADYTIEVL